VLAAVLPNSQSCRRELLLLVVGVAGYLSGSGGSVWELPAAAPGPDPSQLGVPTVVTCGQTDGKQAEDGHRVLTQSRTHTVP
jgi:hypothetical protein